MDTQQRLDLCTRVLSWCQLETGKTPSMVVDIKQVESCLNSFVVKLNDRYLIGINADEIDERLVYVICHEFCHICQIESGDLDLKARTWQGESYVNVEYFSRPFEYAARVIGGKLAEKYTKWK
jgi:hypothetical protein